MNIIFYEEESTKEFFEMEPDFYKKHKFIYFLSKLVELLFASVLWLICSLPLITLGASSTALYYTVNKVIRHERGYVKEQFFHAFRSNLKQSVAAWLLQMLLYGIVFLEFYMMYRLADTGQIPDLLVVILAIATVILMMWSIFLFPYIARFANSTKTVLKYSFIMMLINIPWSLLLFVLFAVFVAITYLLPVTILFMPSVYALLYSLILERIFRKYMTPEDLEAEEERNRVYY